MEYAVVQFEDASYSEVPINWIVDDSNSTSTYCWWPPNNIKNLSTLITRKTLPNPKTWQKHCVSIVNVCSTLAKARQIAENSDYYTTDDDKGKGLRTKFPNSKYLDNDESSNTGSTENVDTAIEENDIPLPAYPQTIEYKKQSKTTSESESQASLKVVNEHLSPGPYSPPFENVYSPLVEEVIEEENVAVKENSANANNLLMTVDQFSAIMKVLTKIEIKIEDLNRRLDKITINNDKLVGSVENVKKYFPLQTAEDVTNFEEQLKNTTVVNEFLIFIDRFGGKSPTDNVCQILNKIFSTQFAALNTWKERKNKLNVSELQLVRIIKDKLIDGNADFREVDFNKEAAEWFRLGLQRKSREGRKQ